MKQMKSPIAATLQPSSDSEMEPDNNGDEYGIQNGGIFINECAVSFGEMTYRLLQS